MKQIGEDLIANKATGLLTKYAGMLDKLDPIQKEYAYYLGVLKASETSELTMEEVLVLGDMIVKCSELGIEITAELTSFWNELGSIAKEIGLTAANFGIKIAAKAIVGYLPI